MANDKYTGMNAWLITWENYKDPPPEKVVAVLSSRRQDRYVAELLELFVSRTIYSVGELAYYANRKSKLVYKAQKPVGIHGVPHGERIFCGHDPWLYGRIVRNLKVRNDRSSDEEIITWQEPITYRWADESKSEITIADEGEWKELRRPRRPLTRDVREC